MKVYIVMRAFYSHDMNVAPGAGEWEPPHVYRVYSTRAEAKKHLRGQSDESDDFIIVRTVDAR